MLSFFAVPTALLVNMKLVTDAACFVSLRYADIFWKRAVCQYTHTGSWFIQLTTAWRAFDTVIMLTSMLPTHHFCTQHESMSSWVSLLLWNRQIKIMAFLPTTIPQTQETDSIFKPEAGDGQDDTVYLYEYYWLQHQPQTVSKFHQGMRKTFQTF